MSQKVKIKGIHTEVSKVEIEISERELISAALPHFTVDDIINAMKLHLEKRFRVNDPTLPEKAEISFFHKEWTIFSYYDHHKGDDVYKTVRAFNEQELQYLMAIESIYHVLNN